MDINQTLYLHNKVDLYPYFQYGGGRRIRTYGALTLNGFQDRRFRPLSQPTKEMAIIQRFFVVSTTKNRLFVIIALLLICLIKKSLINV